MLSVSMSSKIKYAVPFQSLVADVAEAGSSTANIY